MKILITLLKPFSFAPAILMMCVIYSFSAQTGEVSGALSYKVSYQIVETKNEITCIRKKPGSAFPGGIPYRVLCTEGCPYDRILSVVHLHFLPALCLRSPGNLADASCRICMCGFCRPGRISSVFCGRPRAFCKGCGN